MITTLLLIAALVAPVEPSTVTVSVRTADNRAGIRATVSLGGVLQTTDREGQTMFSGFPDGPYKLVVTPEPPYRQFTWVVRVPSTKAISFRLDKP